MKTRMFTFTAVLVSAAMLSACDQSVELDEDTSDDVLVNDSSTTTTPSNNTPPAGLTGLNNPVPQYVTSECGSVAPIEGVVSNNPQASSSISVGSIYSARIDPDSTTNKAHYWNIPVAAGFYHVFLESIRLDEAHKNIGLRLSDVNSGRAELGNIIRGNEVDVRSRTYAFIEVENATTLELSVETNFEAEDYHLAFFENETAVPSPYLTDCPLIDTLVVGGSTTIELGDGFNNATREQWFTIDAAAIDYNITVDAARVDGANSNIIYSVLAYDQFSQKGREEIIVRANERGATSQNSEDWKLSEAVPRWVRIVNYNAPIVTTILIEEN